MAVYKRSYKPYEGRLTPEWSRWLVLANYALSSLFNSKLIVGFTVASYIFPVVAGGLIYLRYNASAISLMGLNPDRLLPIDANFFAIFLSVQGMFSFLFTAYAAPGLIAPDLSNSALPLYLCRPISRAEYVLGKMAVLFIPLSMITWIPGLLLWSFQAGLEGNDWGATNAHLAGGIIAGAVLWIVLLSLLGLALSAWVKWKIAARALLFAVFFISAAFSEMVNEVLDTKMGYLLNLGHLVGTLWARLLSVPAKRTLLGEMFNIRTGEDIPVWAAWTTAAAICGVCILMLNKKLRAREVVS